MPRLTSLSFLSVTAILANGVYGWGAMGHEAIGLIAQNYVTAATKTYMQGLLGSTSTTYLGDVAAWADTYRETTAGKFSAPYHFIDAEDSPPTACSVDFNRDCGSAGCVVAAISNYTSRIKDTKLSATERTNAVKFIVHFVGDIHQPLHDEALDVGGNTIAVKFDNKTTNLHSVWDTAIPEKIIGGGTLAYAQKWATALTASINTGTYASSKSSWLTGMNVSDATATAMVWARDTNALVCTKVIPDGPPTGQELDGAYYTSVVPTVEEQIAKAGYRLAAWLNLIATGSEGSKVKRDLSFQWEPISYLPEGYVNDGSPAKMARRAFGDMCH
ncbi:hypothetical protein BT63DRAFT_51125 [Microthyrium microscopicum]|uniref:S1/P1 nuclease n=1 Tax=Microthyrium microscopicum TaxID=703497 RepID=A0A6A6U3Y8_9PEZI|nr:hypothetical protein BT63DRAFT_51125 [Microthyrium microscopicum]